MAIEIIDTNIKCFCGNKAQIHTLIIQYGKRTEKHQCNSCAAQESQVQENWANFKPGDMK